MTEEPSKDSLPIPRGSDIKVKPKFVMRRNEATAISAADYVKYMVDPDTQMGTLIFYRKYPTADRDEEGNLVVKEVVDESFLEVHVPLSTLFTCALGLYRVFDQIAHEKASSNIIYFGPSKVIRGPEEKTD